MQRTVFVAPFDAKRVPSMRTLPPRAEMAPPCFALFKRKTEYEMVVEHAPTVAIAPPSSVAELSPNTEPLIDSALPIAYIAPPTAAAFCINFEL